MGDQIENAQNPQTAVSALEASRPRFSFKIPESARQLASDPHTVVLRMPTVADDLRASSVAQDSREALGYERLKNALDEVDGRKVTWENDEKDRVVEACSPKVRQFLGMAYTKAFSPNNDEMEAFLGSMAIVVK